MNKNIVIYSHNTHSFLKNELLYASQKFKEVYLITPHDDELRKHVLKFPNVRYFPYSKRDLYGHMVKNLNSLFHKKTIHEIVNAYKNNLLTKKYIKSLMLYLAIESLFKSSLEKKIKVDSSRSEDWVFLSAWYGATAYAIVQAKEKYPKASLVSLAHSFEIDKAKSEFTKVLFRSNYHNSLDLVSFISKNVYETYIKEIAEPLNLKKSNNEVRYLGTEKLHNQDNPSTEHETIRVVSCSYVIPIKRVELIFKTLDTMKGYTIEWTHIGDGKSLSNLREIVENKENSKLKVNLMGNMANEDIHKLYIKNSYDFFINVSIAEGIPVTLMEAIAYGIPIIATDVGGNSEIVREEFGHLLSKKPSTQEIEKAILKIKGNKDKMKSEAISFYEENFNSKHIRSEFYSELLNIKKGN